jgi:hypothetical protein
VTKERDRSNKERKRAWRDQQRAAALADLPLPIEELDALFDMLDEQLPRQGCDHSRRLTRAWLEAHAHDVATVFAWLDKHSGFCDCEVLANVEQSVADVKHAPTVH